MNFRNVQARKLALCGILAIGCGATFTNAAMADRQVSVITVEPLTVTQSTALARRTWGNPACGIPDVQLEATPRADANGDIPWGWVDLPDGCVIHLTRGSIRAGFACETILHEWGHLARGPAHSRDPRSPLYAMVHQLPQCSRTVISPPRARPLG